MVRKFLIISLIAVFCRVPAVTGADLQVPAASLTLNDILDRNASARGGAAAWRAVRAISMHGEMDAGHGVKVPYVLDLKRPRKMRLELEFQGKKAVQVYDGSKGWKLRPFLGRNVAEPMSAEDLRAAAAETDLDGMLIDYQAKGYKLQLAGVEQVDSKTAYKLQVTMPGNIVRHVWIDAATFLEVRVDGQRKMDGKYRTMFTYLRDYKNESGILLPHTLETTTVGVKGSQTLTVQSVVVNPALEDARFGQP